VCADLQGARLDLLGDGLALCRIGQPAEAFSQAEFRNSEVIGFATSITPVLDRVMFQPRSSGGSLRMTLARCVCQSAGRMSTLKPTRSSCALATGPRLASEARSVTCSSTIGRPS